VLLVAKVLWVKLRIGEEMKKVPILVYGGKIISSNAAEMYLLATQKVGEKFRKTGYG